MANRERGEVGVEVDGKAYTLRPTFNSLVDLEDLVDRDIDDILKPETMKRLSGLRILMWCFLHKHHAAEIKTLDDAGDWIERLGGKGKAVELANAVFAANADEAESGAGTEDPPAAQDGTGDRSLSALAVPA